MGNGDCPSSTGNCCLFQRLDDFVLDAVMACLDCRSLLSFASCHKRFLPLVSYEIVLAAARATENGKLSDLLQQVNKQAVEMSEIFMPSSTRLLRLINAQRCELCRQGHSAFVTCGMYLCNECSRLLLILIGGEPPRVRLCVPFTDASGEYVGPCKVSLRKELGGTDTEERELDDLHVHKKRIGWTGNRPRAFRRLFKTIVVPWVVLVTKERLAWCRHYGVYTADG